MLIRKDLAKIEKLNDNDFTINDLKKYIKGERK